MSNTYNLGLPLVQPAQAQKHVTVNEALVRLDSAAQMVLQSTSASSAPLSASDGACWGVPTGASGLWSGHDGEVALWSNGGWVFFPPQQGWRAWVIDAATLSLFDGAAWRSDLVAMAPSGAATRQIVVDHSHTFTAGASNAIVGAIPGDAIVLGVTARVIADVTGTLSSWRIGTVLDDGQFGTGLNLANGSWGRGLLGAPTSFYTPTDLMLTAEGGSFASGMARVTVHALQLDYPLG